MCLVVVCSVRVQLWSQQRSCTGAFSTNSSSERKSSCGTDVVQLTGLLLNDLLSSVLMVQLSFALAGPGSPDKVTQSWSLADKPMALQSTMKEFTWCSQSPQGIFPLGVLYQWLLLVIQSGSCLYWSIISNTESSQITLDGFALSPLSLCAGESRQTLHFQGNKRYCSTSNNASF